jgi:tRNA G18 (ribose-2'-O)-methylase SpoU
VVERVERTDDPRVSEYQHIGDPAWLLARGLFVAEGRLVVQRVLHGKRFPVRSILLTPAALRSLEPALPPYLPVFVAAQHVLNDITGFNFHRGCLAIAQRPQESAGASGGALGNARLLLALEGVGNPDNVGGLFRVAAAFGVDGVLLDPSSGDPFYRKAVRTSMGAVLQLPFARVSPWPDALDTFHERGFTIIALTPRSDAQPLAAFAPDSSSGVIVIVGAEGSGLTEGAMARADARLRIPIAASVDSLNVVVATGVALAHLSNVTRTVR